MRCASDDFTGKLCAQSIEFIAFSKLKKFEREQNLYQDKEN